MPEYTIYPKDPFSLILAPNCNPQSSNATQDIVWEIQLDGGETGGLSLYSTLALSTSSLRIIPIFTNKSETSIKLTQFFSPLVIQKISSDYAKFRIEPFEGIVAIYDLWIKDSNHIIGRISFNNSSQEQFSGSISWEIQYIPNIEGANFMHSSRPNYPYLHGKTQKKHLVFLANGAPEFGKTGRMALENNLSILPGSQQQFEWSFCMNEDLENALLNANSGININLDAEIARMEIINHRNIFYFETGNNEWDLILNASQIAAQQLILKNSISDSQYNFVKSRNPERKIDNLYEDQYSKRFDHQNPLELWYFLQILPNYADIVFEKIVSILDQVFEETKKENRNKLKISHNNLQPFPIIAQIFWDIIKIEPKIHFSIEIFEKLIVYLEAWTKNRLIEHSELTPTWSNPLQSLYEYLPIHDRWHFSSEGLDTKWVKSPMLLSLLFNEFSQTKKLAKHFHFETKIAFLENQMKELMLSIESCWNSRKQSYSYQDLVTKSSYAGVKLISLQGSGKFSIEKKLSRAQRLTFKLINELENTRRLRITINGESNEGIVSEEINPRDIYWYGKNGFYTSKFIYKSLDQAEVLNNPPSDVIHILTSDFTKRDLTLSLPIWAGVCDPKRVERIWIKTIEPEYLQPFGLPYAPISDKTDNSEIINNVDLILNCMVAQGLLQYKHNKEAKQIWTNNLMAVSKNLKLFKRFLKQYDASDGFGTGDYNIINGIPSVTLFLNLVGINKWTKTELVIDRLSVFDEPIMIRYRGNMITTTPDGHIFSSPGGRRIITAGNGPHCIHIPE